MQCLQCATAIVGRLLLSAIFLLSAVGNKIPKFAGTAEFMGAEGMPWPRAMLVGAICFLIVGSVSVIVGFRARIGAALLLTFLVLATCYFHDFWTLDEAQARQEQMIQFMKNLSMMGAMLYIIANGSGAGSLDRWRWRDAEDEACQ